MRNLRNSLLLLVFFAGTLFSFAQGEFQLINLNTEKAKKFKFGNKVMFQLQAKDSMLLGKNIAGVINAETAVYQMVLTGMENQDLIFNGNVRVPYSAIKYLFIKTPGNVISKVLGCYFFGVSLSLVAVFQGGGLIASVFIVPISVVLFRYSEKHYFSHKYWGIEKVGK
jgi:hypothetical protein